MLTILLIIIVVLLLTGGGFGYRRRGRRGFQQPESRVTPGLRSPA